MLVPLSSVGPDGRPSEAFLDDEADDASCFTPVPNLGFSAAPFPPLRPLLETDSLQDTMDTESLRDFFGLEPCTKKTNVQKSIHEKIKKSLCASNGSKKLSSRYLPIDQFELIFGMGPIQALMKELHPGSTDAELRAAVNEVLGRRRVLGILLYMIRLDLMEAFIRDGITDDQLPLHSERLEGFCAGEPNTSLFEDWDDNELALFKEYQPLFLAPFFDIREDGPRYYNLHGLIRLPWLQNEKKKSGGNGTVHRVAIHPSHHNFHSKRVREGEPCYFALKEFPADAVRNFSQELKALGKACVTTRKEKHLITLLLAFHHAGKHYFLFEWADGDLDEFWETHPEAPMHTAAKQKWAAEQCLGIATAVKRIHGLATWQKQKRLSATPTPPDAQQPLDRDFGRHGDIKPQNILWFSTHNYEADADLMVLSDLGLTRYHSILTRSHVLNIDGYTSLYRPPEKDLLEPICSKYDIWSLGCVYLEFCIWWLEGLQAVRRFEDDRLNGDQSYENVMEDKYFIISKSEGRLEALVKPAVVEWIERLRQTYRADIFAQEMLNLIENKMVVVDRTARASADVVCAELFRIVRLTALVCHPMQSLELHGHAV